MTRFFYTGPLAAAWMSQQFGFAIRLNSPAGERLKGVSVLFAQSKPVTEVRTFGSAVVSIGGDTRFYIHPDSEHLLKVQLGDIVSMDKAMERYALVDVEEMRDAFNEAGDYRIIQRGGKAFHWPESEESDGA